MIKSDKKIEIKTSKLKISKNLGLATQAATHQIQGKGNGERGGGAMIEGTQGCGREDKPGPDRGYIPERGLTSEGSKGGMN